MHASKPLAVVAVLALLMGCVSQPVPIPGSGDENNAVDYNDSNASRPEVEVDYNFNPSGQRFANSVGHGRQDVYPFIFNPFEPSGGTGPRGELGLGDSNAGTGCSVQDVAGLQPQQLVGYLKTHSLECLEDFLWDFNPQLEGVLSSDNMVAVLDQVEADSATYDGTNSGNLLELVFFARIGYYHDFYHDLDFAPAVEQNALQAFNAFTANPQSNALSEEAASITVEAIKAIDTAYLSYAYVGFFTDVLESFEVEPARKQSPAHQAVAFSVLFLTPRSLNEAAGHSQDFRNALSQEFLDAIQGVSLDSGLASSASTAYLVSNAVWSTGNVLKVPAWKEAARSDLTQVIGAYEYLSQPYLWAVYSLDLYGDCQLSNGETICREDVAGDLEEQLFPYAYSFDDGVLKVKTSIPVATAQKLYYAIKQVDSQFNRVTETLLPLPRDPNGSLTMIIYGTRSEYENYQWFLYDLATNNGGIYIEQDGTFYTYERTPQESIYSLEELTRHEYVHYLVARYLIEGFWGSAPIYSNNRLVWFDEGLAEFFNWSTQNEGVKVRQRLVSLIQSDGEDRMTVSQILSASYGNFRFYQYAGTFFNYLYENDRESLRQLLRHAHDSDIAAFDALVNSWKADEQLNADYQAYLDGLIDSIDDLDNPSTQFVPLNEVDGDDLGELEEEFVDAGGYLGKCSLSSQSLPRYSCRGQRTGSVSGEENTGVAWQSFESFLNALISSLKDLEENSFEDVVCRFGKISFISSNNGFYPITDYFCEGPLAEDNYAQPARLQRVERDFNATRLGNGANCSYRQVEKIAQVQEDFRQRTWQGVHANCGTDANDSNSVACAHGLSTVLYPGGTENSVLEAELERLLSEQVARLVDVRPSYYEGALSCHRSGPFSRNDYQGQVYATDNARCTVEGLLGSGLIEVTGDVLCFKPLTTTALSSSVPEGEHDRQLEESITELQSQVYAQSPSFYKFFDCLFDGNKRQVNFGNDSRYFLRDANCIVRE